MQTIIFVIFIHKSFEQRLSLIPDVNSTRVIFIEIKGKSMTIMIIIKLMMNKKTA